MKIISGGRTSPKARRFDSDKSGAAAKKAPRRIRSGDDDETAVTIEVLEDKRFDFLYPHSIKRVRPFIFEPKTFVPESEGLNKRFIEDVHQQEWLTEFIADPSEPVVYGVGGNPDDMKAKYFAAFLMQQHVQHLGQRANPHWLQLYYGHDSVRDSYNVNKGQPTMVVISNVTINSTQRRLEDVRDLIERYAGRIPVVVVNAGMDPLSFIATKLNSPIQCLAYFCSPMVRLKEEVD